MSVRVSVRGHLNEIGTSRIYRGSVMEVTPVLHVCLGLAWIRLGLVGVQLGSFVGLLSLG